VNACDRYSTEKALIHEIYHKHKGRYGYRRIDLVLRQTGYLLNHKTVKKLMGELKLKSVVRVKKYKSYRGQVGQSAPNHLARKFEANRPNEKWVTDVTEFNIAGQKVYLSPVLDLFNREIVSFTVDKRPHAHLIPNMLLKALKKLKHDGEFLWHTQIRVLLHQEIYRCRGLH
jgi:transposase InsO family protein